MVIREPSNFTSEITLMLTHYSACVNTNLGNPLLLYALAARDISLGSSICTVVPLPSLLEIDMSPPR